MISSKCIIGVCGAPSKVSSAPSNAGRVQLGKQLRAEMIRHKRVGCAVDEEGRRAARVHARKEARLRSRRPPQADRRTDAVAACVHRRLQIVTQVVHDHPAGRATRQRDAPRINAIGGGVGAHPIQRQPRIGHRIAHSRRPIRPWIGAHTIVGRDADIAASGELGRQTSRCTTVALSLPGRKPPPCSQRITGRKVCTPTSGRYRSSRNASSSSSGLGE